MIEQSGDALVVRLPSDLCLYEEKAASFVAKLVEAAEDLHRAALPGLVGVLVLQVGPADDRRVTWLRELRDEGLFRDVVNRLDTFRWLLSLVRNSPVPWVYMAASDCFGSVWELALSCQRRYWFDRAARLGFPEIEVGAFPPGGVLESLTRRTGRTRERWHARPVSTASEALEDGLIHFCSEARGWESVAEGLFRELLTFQPKAGTRQATRRRRRAGSFDLAASLESRQTAYKQLETVWKQEQHLAHKAPSAWDYCWQLVKEGSRFKEPGELGRLVTHIAARHFLSPSYQAWVQSHLVAAAATAGEREVCRSALPLVAVDLQETAPPTEVLVRLLTGSPPVVLVATDAQSLAAALGILFGRLERALGAPQAQALWERSVTWFQGSLASWPGLVLRWTVDDRFVVTQAGTSTVFHRIEGNAPGAVAGALEWDGRELPDEVRAAALLTADAIIEAGPSATGQGGAGLPLSVRLRSLFFEELLRVSRYLDGDVGAVTEALRGQGWRFAGDDDGWDRFLKTRYDRYVLEKDKDPVRSGLSLAEAATWEVGTWKHARGVAKRLGGDPNEGRWNPTAISQHLGVFAGLLVRWVAPAAMGPSLQTVDHLCSLALGLPKEYGTPRGFIRRRGVRRVAAYARRFWPDLQASFARDDFDDDYG